MTKPVTIPNTFATATTAIPLSQLDSDFSTVATALNDANTYSNYAADTGTANAYVVTLTGVSTTYSAGLRIQFKAGNANTGASTLNVNGGGTKNITFQDVSALSSGTIAANAIVDVMYDGTQFLLMNDPAGTVGTGDVVGPAGATDNAIVRFDGATGKLVQNSVVTIADSTGDVAGVGALSATGNVSFDGGTFVFNESGADKDFRIEGDTDANLFFTDASTDRVGIGTSSPQDLLDISASVPEFRLTSTSGPYSIISSNTGGVLQLMADEGNTGANTSIRFRVDGAEVARFDSSGNLGLGVTPSAWGTSSSTKAFQLPGLSLWGFGNTNAYLNANSYYNGTNRIYTTSSFATEYAQTSGQHQWYTAPSGTAGNAITFTQAMTLDASGNLGIGVTSPSAKLHVQAQVYIKGTSGDGAIGIDINSGASAVTTSAHAIRSGGGSGNVLVIETQTANSNGQILFQTNGTERARITSGGYFKASDNGTYLNSTGSYHELRNTGDNPGAIISCGNASQTGNTLQVESTRNTTNNTFYAINYYNSGAAAYKFRVADSGNVTNTNNSYGAISDVKTKQDIVDAASQWDDLKGLRVRKFRYKNDPTAPLQIGLVAQEAETVSPGLIDEHPDYEELEVTDEEGNVKTERQLTGTSTKSIKYSVLYMKAIKALQEAMARIETLEAKVAALEGTQP
jgi:Chaperone of endosialidase